MAANQHPLMNKYLLWPTGTGGQFQGKVVAKTALQLFVQLYSWVDGRPTEIVRLAKSRVENSHKFKIYPNEEEWRDAAEEHIRLLAEKRNKV